MAVTYRRIIPFVPLSCRSISVAVPHTLREIAVVQNVWFLGKLLENPGGWCSVCCQKRWRNSAGGFPHVSFWNSAKTDKPKDMNSFCGFVCQKICRRRFCTAVEKKWRCVSVNELLAAYCFYSSRVWFYYGFAFIHNSYSKGEDDGWVWNVVKR